jgi:hypothetical protein
MSGETILQKLLAAMEPVLLEGRFVFASVERVPEGLTPVGTFREAEGWTVILPEPEAAGLATATAPMRCISLTIHSAFEAVGLTAAFATELAAHGISANVVAGFYHDHIFMPAGDAARALAALQELSRRHRGT